MSLVISLILFNNYTFDIWIKKDIIELIKDVKSRFDKLLLLNVVEKFHKSLEFNDRQYPQTHMEERLSVIIWSHDPGKFGS